MRICFPVINAKGLESTVHDHFGSAPYFLVFDTETRDLLQMPNNDAHHSQGVCSPIKALNGQSVDAIVVGGIGKGALSRLNQAGIRVYRTRGVTVGENVDQFAAGSLREFTLLQSCGGSRGGCAH